MTSDEDRGTQSRGEAFDEAQGGGRSADSVSSTEPSEDIGRDGDEPDAGAGFDDEAP